VHDMPIPPSPTMTGQPPPAKTVAV
jgi:hypothetical protein